MKKQAGFTLVELIIVIVILGILAVTAAPRFIDIQSDAKASAIEGVKGALQSASQLVYAKSAIGGIQRDATGTVTVSGQSVDVVYGYPDASAINATTITNFVELDANEFTVASVPGDAASFIIFFAGDVDTSAGGWESFIDNDENDADDCYLIYTEPSAVATLPTITSVTGQC